MIVRYLYSKKRVGFKAGSELIMWAEDEKFSHCATEIEIDPDIEPMVYEAVYPISRKIPKSLWLEKSELVHSIPFLITDPELKEAIIKSLEENIGKKYSVMQLFVIGVGLALKLVARAVDKIVVNANKFLICSEYQSMPLKLMGGKFEEPSDSISISETYEVCKKLKGIE